MADQVATGAAGATDRPPPPLTAPVTLGRALGLTAFGLFVVRGLSGVLLYGLHVLAARWLGVEAYGVVTLLTSVIAVLTVLALFGQDLGVVRAVAQALDRRDWPALNGTALTGLLGTAGLATAIGILALVVGLAVWPALIREPWLAVGGLVTLLGGVLTTVLIGLFRGLHRPVLGQSLFALGAPVLTLAALAGLVAAGDGVDASGFMWVRGGALAVIVVAMAVAAALVWPREARRTPPRPAWRRTAIGATPLLLVGVAQALLENVDILVVGALLTEADAGLYGAAARTVIPVGLLLSAVNAAAAPHFAVAHDRQDGARLQRLAAVTAGLGLAGALPLCLGMLIFREDILGLFGPDYVGAADAFAVLLVATLATAAVGSVGPILVMVGMGRTCAVLMCAAVLVDVALSVSLTYGFGLTGAALATLIATVGWNAAGVVLLRRRLDLDPTLLGWLRLREPRRRISA